MTHPYSSDQKMKIKGFIKKLERLSFTVDLTGDIIVTIDTNDNMDLTFRVKRNDFPHLSIGDEIEMEIRKLPRSVEG